MRRADRLFQIIQLLRRRRRTLTGAQLAEHLGVSTRTVYRDIRDLNDSGVPIVGEAGVGYALSRTYDLPPLMFDDSELEALVLGARIVRAWADRDLARAAETLLAKVEAVVPERLRHRISGTMLYAFDFHPDRVSRERLGALRLAIREHHKVSLDYRDRHRAPSQRVVQPLGLLYWGATWSLAAWCELRNDFRNFRIDRIQHLEIREEPFEIAEGRSLADMFQQYEERENPRNPNARACGTAGRESVEPEEKTVSAIEIGKQLVALCNDGKGGEVLEMLYADDIVSIEGQGSEEIPARMEGIEAIKGKNQWWYDNHEIHSMTAAGPFCGHRDDQFVVEFDMDVTNKPSGQRIKMREVGIYTLRDGKVAQEEFLYLMA